MASSLGGAILNEAEIGAPKSSALAAWSVSASDHPYSPGTPGASRRSTWNSEMKTGIWGRIGRQPASGLTPRSFCRAIIAWLMPCRSLPYCLRSLAISGCSSCIARCDFTCLTKSGKRITRMVTTRKMIDKAQVMPPAGSRKVDQTACHHFITVAIAVYSQSSNGGLLLRGRARGRPGGVFGTARRVAGHRGSGRGHEIDTAGVPGSALHQPAQRQPAPAGRAVPCDRLGGVGAARRVEPAPRRECRTDRRRVERDGAQQQAGDHRAAVPWPSNRSRPATRSCRRAVDGASAASARARTTRSAPAASRCSSAATTARSRRVTRWRTTELPTALPTTKPARAPGGGAKPLSVADRDEDEGAADRDEDEGVVDRDADEGTACPGRSGR